MITGLLLAASLTIAPPQAKGCLHGADETAEERTRRQRAIGAARAVNTAQFGQPGAAKRQFLTHAELAALPQQSNRLNFAPDAEILAGWRLTLDRTGEGYWFMIRDTTDPCGFAVFSNQEAVIYTGQRIR